MHFFSAFQIIQFDKPSKQSGFTMIELVIIIVVVGILAAAALPRFSNLKTQAQIAANQAFAGALRSAINILHTAWIAQGATGTSVTINMEGVASYGINSFGWRSANSNTTATATTCASLLNSATAPNVFIKNAPQIVVSASSCSDSSCYVASGSNSVCTYTLQDGNNGNASPTRTVTYNLITGNVVAN